MFPRHAQRALRDVGNNARTVMANNGDCEFLTPGRLFESCGGNTDQAIPSRMSCSLTSTLENPQPS